MSERHVCGQGKVGENVYQLSMDGVLETSGKTQLICHQYGFLVMTVSQLYSWSTRGGGSTVQIRLDFIFKEALSPLPPPQGQCVCVWVGTCLCETKSERRFLSLSTLFYACTSCSHSRTRSKYFSPISQYVKYCNQQLLVISKNSTHWANTG